MKLENSKDTFKNLFYCCYSSPMHEFMREKGIDSELKAMNIQTKRVFWLYIKTDEFKTALKEWTLNKLD